MVLAWYMDDSTTDQRLPHMSPGALVSMETVAALGVNHWKVNFESYETDGEFRKLREDEGYTYMDVIEISPEKLPSYDEKIKMFYEEHLHDDDEIRLIIGGTGYFDVRDKADRWIRIECSQGDMISLPTGIYHRFTTDSKNYVKAVRLFKGNPVWTPINRSEETDSHRARQNYIESFSLVGCT